MESEFELIYLQRIKSWTLHKDSDLGARAVTLLKAYIHARIKRLL